MRWLIFAALIAPPAIAQPAGERLANQTIGVALTRPAGWTVVTADQNAANLEAVHGKDSEFMALAAKYATAPLYAFAKHAEPYPDLNPSFKINLRPMGTLAGRSAIELIELILPALQRTFPDLRIVQAPTPTIVGGLPAGYVRAEYTVSAAGQTFPTTSELWIVPRGRFFFMIGAGTRTDERSGTRAEVRQIVDGMIIEPGRP